MWCTFSRSYPTLRTFLLLFRNEEGHRTVSFFRWLQWRDLEPNDLREPLAAADNEIAIFLNGINYTNSLIPARASGTLELRIVSGEESIVVPTSSVLGSQAGWSIEAVDGSASISGDQLTTDSGVNGILKVSCLSCRCPVTAFCAF